MAVTKHTTNTDSNDIQRALRAISKTPNLLVASDFDGTIAPIVAHAADARPLPGACEALAALGALPNTTAALISGRARRELALLCGAPRHVHLIGSHGSEFDNDFLSTIDAGATELLAQLINTMTTIAARYPGVSLEIKPASVALHVRNADASHAQQALDDALAAVTGTDVYITEGKAVREFAVIDTSKGNALKLLRQQHHCDAVVYFGDDVTDEKAFSYLSGADLGIKVGSGDTAASLRVDTVHDVVDALSALLEMRHGWLDNHGQTQH